MIYKPPMRKLKIETINELQATNEKTKDWDNQWSTNEKTKDWDNQWSTSHQWEN